MKNQLIYRYIYSKGVAEHGKETNTCIFFCGSVDPLPTSVVQAWLSLQTPALARLSTAQASQN